MSATPSWVAIMMAIFTFLLISGIGAGIFSLFVFTGKKNPGNGSRSRGFLTWLLIPVALFLGLFLLALLSYRTVRHEQVNVQVQQAVKMDSRGEHRPDVVLTQEASETPGSHVAKVAPVRLKLTFLALGILILIGGACCFALYVYFATRKPIEPTTFQPQSMFWLLPIVGMWGVVSWLYFSGVMQGRGHSPLPWNTESNLLLEHGGFEEENVLAWYQQSGSFFDDTTKERTGKLGAYPQWILDAQAYNENTKVYYSPATFVLMGTGDSKMAAVENALKKAVPNAINHFRLKHQTNKGPTTFPAVMLKNNVTDLYAVKGTIKTGLGDQYELYRVWVRVALETNSNSPSYHFWKSNLIESRIMSLVGFLGFLVFSFIVLTVYLRLNQRSERKYQNRLRLATLVVLIPVGLFVCGILYKFV